MAEPPTKRSRNDKDEGHHVYTNKLLNVSPELFDHANSISSKYLAAKPYPHHVLENIFVDGFLNEVLDEVKHNLKATFKESDLFRVYQSIDLGNLDPLDATLTESIPALMKLRSNLYSPKWRSFIEQISGVEKGSLIDKVDCAVNCHDKGCHLLCHDDVIGTRKVSYIFYLTDPEPEWKDEDGGRLELYESMLEQRTIDKHNSIKETEEETETRVPGVFPVKTILPKFNSMAYFVVEPGVSFHSVQEVFCDRPRLSIQGWYHTKEPPLQIHQASLHQLKSFGNRESDRAFVQFEAEESSGDLTKSDLEFLQKYINKTYTQTESIKEIRQRFEEESSVQLRHFFNEEWSSKIKAESSMEDKRDFLQGKASTLDYSVGVSKDWSPVGPSHKQRFLEFRGNSDKDAKSCGPVMKFLKRTVLQSKEFGRFLKSLTNLGLPLGSRGSVRRFRPGLDYTIAHHGILTKKSVLDATICFCSGTGDQCIGSNDDNDDDAIWESGDKGGFECYIEAYDNDKEGSEADDEYDGEDDSKLLSVSASNNTLSLVFRDPGTIRFVKYVSHSAPSSRWDISMEYEIVTDE